MLKAKSVWHYFVERPSINSLFETTLYFLGYMICLFLVARYFPKIPAKSPKKKYQLTGLSTFLTVTVSVAVGYYTEQLSLLFLVENYYSFFIVMNSFAILFSLYLFKRREAVKAAPKATRPIDFWNGREKDPMFYKVDLKIFFYQPSLIGLALMNVALAEAQYTLHGRLTIGMMLYQSFWYLYLFTHYIREDFMLWTFDIIEDHFGFMLVWGDLIYVPFLYSIAGWFVANNVNESLSFTWLILTVLIHCIGHYVFRVSNWQKYDVRREGAENTIIWGEKAKMLEGRLLISGFWGIGRHVNYTGEIMLYLSIALCSGTISFVPYILPVSLFILLAQRAHRDDQRCRNKYGEKLWGSYCRKATFRMIPFIY